MGRSKGREEAYARIVAEHCSKLNATKEDFRYNQSLGSYEHFQERLIAEVATELIRNAQQVGGNKTQLIDNYLEDTKKAAKKVCDKVSELFRTKTYPECDKKLVEDVCDRLMKTTEESAERIAWKAKSELHIRQPPSETERQLKLIDIADISVQLYERDEVENLCHQLGLTDPQMGRQFSIYNGDYVKSAAVLLVTWFDGQLNPVKAYTKLREALGHGNVKQINFISTILEK